MVHIKRLYWQFDWESTKVGWKYVGSAVVWIVVNYGLFVSICWFPNPTWSVVASIIPILMAYKFAQVFGRKECPLIQFYWTFHVFMSALALVLTVGRICFPGA